MLPSAVCDCADVAVIPASGPFGLFAIAVGVSGLLGSAICRRLVQCDDVEVVAVTRRGRPREAHRDRRWTKKVTCECGDVLRPSTFAPLLARCSAVVHSVGMIAESSAARKAKEHFDLGNGRGATEGAGSRGSSSSSCSSSSSSSSSSSRSAGGDQQDGAFYKQWFDPEARDQGGAAANGTFEAVNRDTAVLLAAAASECSNIQTVVYVSSANMPDAVKSTLVDERYERSKRDAEAALLVRGSMGGSNQSGNFRPVILRPGFMVSEDRPASLVLGVALVRSQISFTSLSLHWC